MATKKKAESPSGFKRRNYGRNHAYYLDGVKLDGVTTLLGDGMRKAAIEHWAGNVTAGYAVDNWDKLSEMSLSQRLEVLKKARFTIRDEAANRGTEVHRLAELVLRGESVDVPDVLRGHVEAAVKFLDDWGFEAIVTEASCYQRAGMYAGTFDSVGTVAKLPGRVILLDWKTSGSGIYGETALQLEAYSRTDKYLDTAGKEYDTKALGITDHWAIWVRSDGYDVYPMARGDEVYKTFQYVATVARRTGGSSRPLDALKGEPLFVPGGALEEEK